MTIYVCNENCRDVERAGMVVIYKKKILTVLGKASNKWGLPKGEMFENEKVIDAAIRELYEETGLVIEEDMKNKIEPFFSTEYTHYFKLDISNNEYSYSLNIQDKNEIKKCKFMSINNINNLYTNHDLRYLLKNSNALF